MLLVHFRSRQPNLFNQSTERNVMSSCGKSLTSTSSMCILDQGSTIPALVDYEGTKLEGASGLQTLHRRQLSNSDSDNFVVQIIDPLVGAASCQGLRGEVSASSQGDRRCSRPCGSRLQPQLPQQPWPPLRPQVAAAPDKPAPARGDKT